MITRAQRGQSWRAFSVSTDWTSRGAARRIQSRAVSFPRLTLAWEFLGWSGNFRALRANCTESHAAMKIVLPRLQMMLHDRSARVRCSFARLLVGIRDIKSIAVADVVPVSHLHARLVADADIENIRGIEGAKVQDLRAQIVARRLTVTCKDGANAIFVDGDRDVHLYATRVPRLCTMRCEV